MAMSLCRSVTVMVREATTLKAATATISIRSTVIMTFSMLIARK